MYLGKVVEIGDALDVMDAPRHPYTIALLDAIPKIRRSPQEQDMPPLAGEAPDVAHIPSGCRFHPRCPLALDWCRDEEPPLLEVAPGRISACWLATKWGSQPRRTLAAPTPQRSDARPFAVQNRRLQ
jgi:oligopeptide/dipeptide ABC transporter ATP-binding protein